MAATIAKINTSSSKTATRIKPQLKFAIPPYARNLTTEGNTFCIPPAVAIPARISAANGKNIMTP